MMKLIKLELKRNNIRTYLLASAASSAFLLVFIYFIANAAQLENTAEFTNYANIFRFACVISLLIFGAMSAVMYSRYIIGEYFGKRVALLFSYPVNRSKVLLAKLLLVFAFTSISMIICTFVPFFVFYLSESVSPIVKQDVLSLGVLTDAAKMLAVSALTLGGAGIVAMRIGFIKKSVPITIISAIVLCALCGNVLIALFQNNAASFNGVIIAAAGLAATAIVMAELSRRVNRMEVEI